MKLFKKFCLIIMIPFSLSCVDTVDGDLGIKKKPSRVTVNALVTADRVWTIDITKSTSILSNDPSEPVNNAVVSVTDSDNITQVMTSKGQGKYSCTGACHPALNRHYALQIDIPGINTIAANTEIPSKVEINSATFSDSTKLIADEFYGTAGISFKDNRDTENYYQLILFQKDEDGKNVALCLTTENISVENNIGKSIVGGDETCLDYVVLSDKLFNGKSFSISIDIKPQFPKEKIYVQLRSCSSEMFQYLLTYSKQKSSRESPFSEPTEVFSNINNGLGIFAGYSADRRELQRD